MPRTVSYNDRHKLEIVELTRKIVSELPNSVYDYILAISDTTQPLTRYAYSYDLRLFLNYLQKENPRFSSKELIAWTDQDFENVSVRDITMFLDYLSLYFNEDDEMVSNQNVGKQRKFYSVR